MAIVDHLKNAAGEVWDAIKDGADWVQDKIKQHAKKIALVGAGALTVMFFQGRENKKASPDDKPSPQMVELQNKIDEQEAIIKEQKAQLREYRATIAAVHEKYKSAKRLNQELSGQLDEAYRGYVKQDQLNKPQQQPQSENPHAAKRFNTKKTVEEAAKQAVLQDYFYRGANMRN